MASSSFPTSNGSQRWLRQCGSVKEYNEFFDDVVSKLELPERYLVMTYVAGLKEEIAESVKLFNPLTMRQARLFARTEETCLQWQAERARKALDDKEDNRYSQKTFLEVQEASAFSEKGEFCLNATQGCIGVQESSRVCEQSQENPQDALGAHPGLKTLLPDDREVMKLLDIHEQKKLDGHNDGLVGDFRGPETWISAKKTTHEDVGDDDEQEVSVIHEDDGSSSPTQECVKVQESQEMATIQVLQRQETSEGGNGAKTTRLSFLESTMRLSHATEKNKDAKAIANEVGFASNFRTSVTWKARVDESSNVVTHENFLGVSHNKSSCSASLMNVATLPTPVVPISFLPLNPLSASLTLF